MSAFAAFQEKGAAHMAKRELVNLFGHVSRVASPSREDLLMADELRREIRLRMNR